MRILIKFAGRLTLAMSDDPPYTVGYGRPPKSTQFPKKTSGNPGGGPKGPRKKSLPYDAVLGREATIVEDGVRRTVLADEAFLHYLLNQALTKQGRLRAVAVKAFGKRQTHSPAQKPRIFVFAVYPQPGEVDKPMRQPNMAHLLDPWRPTAKLVIEPWLVQKALARLGDRRLTIAEQQTIMGSTRKPHSVEWPSWWEVKPA